MATWAPQNLGSNISQIVSADDTQDDAVRSHERGTTTPPYPVRGQLHCKTDHSTLGEAFMFYNGSTWTVFADPEAAQVNASGTVAFAANQPMGGFKLTGLAAGSANGDSVRYEQVLLLAGGTMTGSITLSGSATITGFGAAMNMNSQKITNLAAPSDPSDAARKADVTSAAPTASTFTTSTGGTASATVTLGFQPTHLIITLERASGGSNILQVQTFGTAASETVGGIGLAGYVAFTFTRTGTGFTISFANPNSGSAWNGRVLAWQ